MTPGDFSATTHQQLGELVATSRATQESIRRLEESLRRSEEKSDTSRAAMHRRLDESVERVSKVEGSVALLAENIEEMKPLTDDVRKWKIMGVTALTIIGIGGAAIGVTFAETLRRVLSLVFAR